MKPLEAYHIISQCIDELARLRHSFYGHTKGYTQEEIAAQVVMFEALRRMEEDEGHDKRDGRKG